MSSRLPILAFVLLAAGCAGGRPRDGRPEAALAQSRHAQSAYRELRQRWFSADSEQRKNLEQPLVDFLARFGGDARAPSVETYLAWVYVKKGELERAQALVARARASRSPAVRDFAAVAEASILIERGEAARALELLVRLDRKVIDPEERLVYGEQRANAAFAARRWRDALRALESWVNDAPAHSQDDVQALALRMLRSFPIEELERSLRELDSESKAGRLSAGKVWMRMVLRERLTGVALETSDFELARRLLDTSPASIRSGERGALLVRLAASGALTPLIAGRSLGLVLGVQSAAARRRSASVAAGMARALGLPESEADPSEVRLLVQDDGGEADGTRQALASLAAEGAAILVAGVDDEGAAEALGYAEAQRIPVLILRAPERAPNDFGFVLGVDDELERAALDAEIAARGLSPVAEVGPNGARCDAVAERAGEPRFPVQVWKRDKVAALTLLSDAGCARDVEAEVLRARLTPTLLCGLECAELARAPEQKLVWLGVGSGRFPAARRSELDGKGQADAVRTPLTFYEALGHDAAVLAKAALHDFPLERVDDAEVVVELHARAERNLGSATAELWSSEKRGFEGRRVLPRTLAVVGRTGAGR